MAFSVTNIGVANDRSNATVSIAVPVGGVPTGATIFLGAVDRSASGSGSVSDGVNTYFAIDSAQLAGNLAGGFGSTFYAWGVTALTSSNSITYTKGAGTVNSAAITACYITGTQTVVSSLDAAAKNSNTGNRTATSVTSGTPSQSNELFIAVAAMANNVTFTNDASFSTPPNESSWTGLGPVQIDGGNFVSSGSGAVTYSPSWNANSTNAVLIVAFKPAGSVNSKAVSASSAQSVNAFTRNHGKFLKVTSAQSFAIVRFISKTIVVIWNESISIVRAIKHVVPLMTSAQTVIALKTVKKIITAFVMPLGSVLVRHLAKPVIAAMTNAQVFAPLSRAVGKIVTITSVQSFGIIKAMARIVTPITMAQTVVAVKKSVKTFALTQAQTVAIQNTISKIVKTTNAAQVRLVKTVGKNIVILSGELTILTPRLRKYALITLTGIGQNVAVVVMTVPFALAKELLSNVVRRFIKTKKLRR